MLKKMILYVVSSGIGTFACKLLETTPMNVWVARGIGCAVAVLVALLMYKVWIENRKETIAS